MNIALCVIFYKTAEDRIRNPDVAKRVRHISYFDHAPTVFPRKWIAEKTSFKNRFQNLFNKSTPTEVDMADTMTCFTNLVSLDLRFFLFDKDNYFEDCVPLIHANLKTSFAQLQSLVLSFPLTYYSVIILPDLFFPCLTSLSMSFFGPTEEATFSGVAATTILPFTNRHRQSLNSVLFRAMGGIVNIMDLSPLYQGLGHIPSLRKVGVSITSSTQPAIIGRFLEMHRETLCGIQIGLIDPPYSRVDELFQFMTEDFLNLENFSVKCSGFHQSPVSQESLDITADFIKKCSPSLVSLDLLAGAHSTRKLRELLIPRRGEEPRFRRLKHLYISIRTLTPDILDMFASQLPNLYALELFASSLKCRENLPDIVIDYYEVRSLSFFRFSSSR